MISNKMRTKKYRSKVSYGLLAFIFLVFFVPLIPIALNGSINFKTAGTILFLVVLFGFIVHLFFKTDYTITADELIIKSGFFFFKTIKIAEITKIKKTKSPLSAPAPSFDRIEIRY